VAAGPGVDAGVGLEGWRVGGGAVEGGGESSSGAILANFHTH